MPILRRPPREFLERGTPAGILAEVVPGVRHQTGGLQGRGGEARGRAGVRAAPRLSAAAPRSKPAALPQRP
eukprot:2798865-Pyramimonas_sp.AAC.1